MEFAHFSHVWSIDGMSAADRFELLFQELELSDEIGFDYAFCVEHHFTPHESLISSPSLFVAAAAQRTKRIRLGPMGYVAPLHQPLRVIEEAAILDQMSRGRLELGLVPGISPHFFSHFDADFMNRRERTQATIELLKAAYAEKGEFSFEGEGISLKGVELSVKPAQHPHPPIWWETRDPETLTWLAEEGFNAGYFLLMPRSEVGPRYRRFLEQWDEAGHVHRPKLAYWSLVYVDETDEIAMEKALPHALKALSLFFSVGPGASQERTVELFEGRGEHGAAELVKHLLDPDYLEEKNLLFIGSPETVRQKIEAAATEGVFNTLFCEVNFGDLPKADLMSSIRRMGEEVIPKLRDFDPTR